MIKQFIALLSIIACTQLGFAQDLNKELAPLKWRNIGPFRGGRSNTATGVINHRDIYYMGTTGGGLWKTENSGISWNNISDGFFKTGSVGAVAVAESDANIVYVGMGEHAVRGVMTHHGDGVYKSTDAGKTWKKMGLDATQHISRITIDPKNPNIVFVAAQGALYSKSTERGIYKSIDGGVTWKKVLYVDDKTGCAELSMDMQNPSILYAVMWEHGRLPWQVISGGPGSGLYKSTDGGNNWEKMNNGLPKEMGKMSIAVSRANSEKVYALIESDFSKDAGGLYVSDDAGASWSQINKSHRLIQRGDIFAARFGGDGGLRGKRGQAAPATPAMNASPTSKPPPAALPVAAPVTGEPASPSLPCFLSAPGSRAGRSSSAVSLLVMSRSWCSGSAGAPAPTAPRISSCPLATTSSSRTRTTNSRTWTSS